MKIQSTAIIGAGALGLMYLDSMKGVLGKEAFFFADDQRAGKLKSTDFQLNGEEVRFPVRTGDELESPVDLVLVSVKNHNLQEIMPLLNKACGPDTIVISVLNGIGSESILEETLPTSTVLYCAVLGMDAVKEGNSLNFSHKGKFLLGTKDNRKSPELESLCSFLDNCGLPYELPADIHKELWFKWMINIGINQTSALMGAPYGAFQQEGPARDLMNEAMAETINLARAANVALDLNDMERWYKVLSTLGPEGKTSMLQDMEAKRKTEVESFSGDLIRLAEEKGVEVPVNRTLNRLIIAKESIYLKKT